jgi:hypothetical protein
MTENAQQAGQKIMEVWFCVEDLHAYSVLFFQDH